MIVEMVGPPGSGKSRLAVEVGRRLGWHVIDLGYGGGNEVDGRPSSRRQKLWGWLTAALRRPGLTMRLTWLAHRANLPRRLGLEIGRRGGQVRRLVEAGSTCIVDEGPLHRLASLLTVAGTSDVRLARRIDLPDAAILVSADPAVALARVESRGHPNELLRWPHEEALGFISSYEALAREMLELARVPVVAATNAADVARQLTALAEARRPLD